MLQLQMNRKQVQEQQHQAQAQSLFSTQPRRSRPTANFIGILPGLALGKKHALLAFQQLLPLQTRRLSPQQMQSLEQTKKRRHLSIRHTSFQDISDITAANPRLLPLWLQKLPGTKHFLCTSPAVS